MRRVHGAGANQQTLWGSGVEPHVHKSSQMHRTAAQPCPRSQGWLCPWLQLPRAWEARVSGNDSLVGLGHRSLGLDKQGWLPEWLATREVEQSLITPRQQNKQASAARRNSKLSTWVSYSYTLPIAAQRVASKQTSRFLRGCISICGMRRGLFHQHGLHRHTQAGCTADFSRRFEPPYAFPRILAPGTCPKIKREDTVGRMSFLLAVLLTGIEMEQRDQAAGLF
ncbi:uncharacterized protein BKA78DRAFT_158107 [Phyllosticta capitalensis]|uniref:uncharacterized protein n=1 Tax=Phyllosticta capitalensis TaxID=121624 RepID=UPI00312D6838